MLMFEFRLISVESIGHKNRDIIMPFVPRGGTKQNPPVVSGDFVERSHPSARPYKPLFIKNEERALNIRVFLDVVPTINSHANSSFVRRILSEPKIRKLFFPLEAVSFSRCRNYVQVYRILCPPILTLAIHFHSAATNSTKEKE
jgi:hypothetical protein